MIAREKIHQVIGKGFADKLDTPVFKVNENWFCTRREMVEDIGCANFIAAARLAKVLKRLKVNTPNQLSKLDPFSLVRAKGIGEAALFVAMCILDAYDYDVMKWWNYKDNKVKFSSYKHHAIREARKHKQEVA